MHDKRIKPSEFKVRAARAARAARETDRRQIDAAVDEYAAALASRVLAEQTLRDAKHDALARRARAVRLGVGIAVLKSVEQSVDRTVHELAAQQSQQPDGPQPVPGAAAPDDARNGEGGMS
jgi:hypothetical protein